MVFMKGVICYISSSGHTELASQYMACKLKNIHVDLVNISRDPTPNMDQYDLVGFATYTDYMNAPLGMKDFIGSLPQQNGRPAFVFSTYALSTGWTLKFLSDWAGKKGFHIVAAGRLSMPECYPILRNIGFKKDNNPSHGKLDRFCAFIAHIDLIAKRIKNGEHLKGKKIWPSFLDMMMPALPRKTAKFMMGKKFVDINRCNSCGVCESSCPYNAISLNDYPHFNEDRCNGCFSCYSKCPTHAIYTTCMKDIAFYSGPSKELKGKLTTE